MLRKVLRHAWSLLVISTLARECEVAFGRHKPFSSGARMLQMLYLWLAAAGRAQLPCSQRSLLQSDVVPLLTRQTLADFGSPCVYLQGA